MLTVDCDTKRATTSAIFLWNLLQLAALTIAASGIPLWANHPLPRESIAVHEMIVMEIAAAAMLFPILLPNFLTMVLVTAMVWPFVHLAGFLSSTPEKYLLAGCSFVSLWIAGLWLCNTVIRSPAEKLIGVCVVELLSLGGGIYLYFYLESASNGTANPEIFGPLVTAVRLVNGNGGSCIGWSEAAIPLVVGVVWKTAISSDHRREPSVP